MAFNFFNGLFLVAYLLSAAVQYNDPDSLPWMLVYAAAAGMCAAQYGKILPLWLPPSLPIFLLCISVAWLLSLMPALLTGVSWQEIFESVSMQNKAVEEAREIGGLALVAVWAAALTYRRARSKG